MLSGHWFPPHSACGLPSSIICNCCDFCLCFSFFNFNFAPKVNFVLTAVIITLSKVLKKNILTSILMYPINVIFFIIKCLLFL